MKVCNALLAVLWLICCASPAAAQVTYEARGVSSPVLDNVLRHVGAYSFQRQARVSEGNYDTLLDDAVQKAKIALRPYGFYHPTVTARVAARNDDSIVIELDIVPGMPLVVDEVNIRLEGDGAGEKFLTEWRANWPLVNGKILDQTIWEDSKQSIIGRLQRRGYLAAEHVEHEIELDLETYRANISLTLDTGPQYRFGNIELGDHVLKPGIVEYIPRFEPGQAFNSEILDKYRVDLWKSGYFTEVVVEEIPRHEQSPPVVDLKASFETKTRNTYQGAIGYGTDTEARLQALWSRHPMSSNGDRIDVGVGWQQLDNEYSLRATYQIPRKNRARQFWKSELTLRHENIELDVRLSPDEDFIRIAEGDIDEVHLRAGRLKVRNFKSGYAQAFETLFVQALHASDELNPVVAPTEYSLFGDPEQVRSLLRGRDDVVSIGFDYDLVSINGKAWETSGHRERAWVFGTGSFLGAEKPFFQVYASTRRSYLYGDRWKFIVRAEAGYTDAKVDEFDLEFGGAVLPLSVTELPNFYRFKAGGTQSVRGYGFEELSNNNLGSNNILTASAEVEFKVLENWSGALFYDIGNAFNDWSRTDLRKGVGVGVRWYSIAGPIRIDIAQALDLEGKPWRIHFNIGTPLL